MATVNEQEKKKQIGVTGEQLEEIVGKKAQIELNAKDIAYIKETLDNIKEILDNLGDVSGVAELQEQVSTIETDLKKVNDLAVTDSTEIASLKIKTDTTNENLESLQSRVTELEEGGSGSADLTALQEQANTNTSDISDLKTGLSEHTASIEALETNLPKVYEDVTAETNEKLAPLEANIGANAEAIDTLETDILSVNEKISSLTLGLHTDGLFYIFINNEPVGNGISLPEASGDVYGNVDSGNNIVLNGDLADGTYTIKYEMVDGSTVDIGELVLDSTVEPEEPTSYTNILTSGDYTIVLNKRWSSSSVKYSDCNGMISLNIPIEDVLDKTIRFKGFTANQISDNSKPIWMTNKSDNTLVTKLAGTPTGSEAGSIWHSSYLTSENDVYSLPINDTTFPSISEAAYLTINMSVSTTAIDALPDGLIMTIDEEIE